MPGCGNEVVSILSNAGPVSVEEVCDDGNDANNDGCTSNCLHVEKCGDNTPQTSEQCDDGNVVNNDGCDAACKDEDCGNSIVTLNEQCDDGNDDNTDGCIITSGGGATDPFGPLNCALARCGDNFHRPVSRLATTAI